MAIEAFRVLSFQGAESCEKCSVLPPENRESREINGVICLETYGSPICRRAALKRIFEIQEKEGEGAGQSPYSELVPSSVVLRDAILRCALTSKELST